MSDDPGYTSNGEPITDAPAPTDSGGWLSLLEKYGGDLASLVAKYGPIALEGLNIAQSATNQGKSNAYAGQALTSAQDAYNAKALLSERWALQACRTHRRTRRTCPT